MVLLHKDRYSSVGVPAIKTGVVIHDSESGDATHDILIRLLQAPGDRDNGHGGRYGAGYHAVTDGNGSYTEVADATCGPYSAPPVNKTWWHVCMPGRANQTREQWLDVLSLEHIKGVAHFVVDKFKTDGFPLYKATVEQMKVGGGGYCSHHDVSLAWKQTNHTDPGSGFPWDILHNYIFQFSSPGPLPPVGDDEMAFLIRPDGDAAVFIIAGSSAIWARSQELINARRADGTLGPEDPRVVNAATLKTYVLYGIEPDYSGGDGGLPGRIKATNFAAWIK